MSNCYMEAAGSFKVRNKDIKFREGTTWDNTPRPKNGGLQPKKCLHYIF